jgi:hypothetical protein
MKNSILVVLGSVLFSGFVFSADMDSWDVKSIEKQFDKSTELDARHYSGVQQQRIDVDAFNDTTKQATKLAKSKGVTSRAQAQVFNQAFWIFDAWVEFYHDDDRDGYFNHFAVEFDADTEFSSALVYARLYLGKDEVFQEFHTTSDFTIFSDSSTDSFVVESELLNGFRPDEYEVLIELYDAYSHELVAAFDGNNDADLYLLSLESQEYEVTQVVVVTEHGGSLGIWGLLLLPLLVLRLLPKRLPS